jgi:hypothetical protein
MYDNIYQTSASFSLAAGTQLFSPGHTAQDISTPSVGTTLSRATTAIAAYKIVITIPVSVRYATLNLTTAESGNTISVALVNSALTSILVQWKISVATGTGNQTADSGSYVTLLPGVYYLLASETFASTHALIQCFIPGGGEGGSVALINGNSNQGLVLLNQTTSSGVFTAPFTVSQNLGAGAEHLPLILFN